MITQIEIDGFKTFKDFKVELAPFQVIVGPNGSGKSNLFDALHLLSRLADTDLLSAFQELRGDAGELFTKLTWVFMILVYQKRQNTSNKSQNPNEDLKR
jgi:AAA15 family ATPase/GTPase